VSRYLILVFDDQKNKIVITENADEGDYALITFSPCEHIAEDGQDIIQLNEDTRLLRVRNHKPKVK
jgi:hypothetical protein